jgi:hypothetical protein
MADTSGPGGSMNISEPRNIGRIAQIVALVGFVLPWITVSCQGQVLAQVSGLDLALGRIAVHLPSGMGASAPTPSGSPNLLVAAALAIILIGLVLTFTWKDARMALANVAGSIVALALIAYEVLVAAVNKAHAQAAASQPTTGADANNPFTKGLAEAIKVGTDYGFWLTCIALAAAAFFYWKASTRRVDVSYLDTAPEPHPMPAATVAPVAEEPPPLV